MEILLVAATFGLTTMVGAIALVIRADGRRNAIWAGQWAERLERERQEDHAAALAESEVSAW